MTRWRLATAMLLVLSIGLPLAVPFFDLVQHAAVWQVWQESERLLQLAANTLLLVLGTLALTLPVGVFGAVLQYRTDLPFRGFFRFLTILTLFIPLPLIASAWQATLGTSGLLPLHMWSATPWAQGMFPAIWVHAVAGLPWVIWLAGQGLCWVERELEEDALLVTTPWGVFWHVTLPRCRASLFAAGLWIALQTATEITVTDMMGVRTFAEEVYRQFVQPDIALSSGGSRDVLARAMAVSVPGIALTWLLVVWAARRWERNLPPMETASAPLCLFQLGRMRWPIALGLLVVAGFLAGVPVASLVWKAGLAGSPQSWSAATTWKHLGIVAQVHWPLIAQSLFVAGAAGVGIAGLALVTCWLATESRRFLISLLLLLGAAWAMPGPVVGIGLKESINVLVEAEAWVGAHLGWRHFQPLAVSLYYGPSALPLAWAFLLRFFPYAVALLWPVVRLLPAELRDAARVDGARPWQELAYVVLPLTLPACVRAALAVAMLSLGELSAGKLVETPGSPTLAHVIFEQMHYGVTNNLAALCLILLLMAGIGGALVALLAFRARR